MKTLLAVLLTSCLFFASCGGGGGGGGDDEVDPAAPPEVLGPYQYVELVTAPQSFRFTEVGPAQVDAAGVLTGSTQRYFDFLTSPEGLSPQQVFVQGPDGALRNLDAGGDLLRTGGLGEGNQLALLAAGDDSPNLVVLARPTTSAASALRAGRHHFAILAPRVAESNWGHVDVAADGSGLLTVVATRNVNRALSPSSFETINLQPQSGGAVTIEVFGEGGPPFEFAGVVSDGGRLVLASRTDTGGDPQPMLLAAVRAPTNADDRLFAGRYWIAAFFASYDEGSDQRDQGTLIGTVEADGAGGCRLDCVLNLDGAFQDFEDPNGTYEVEADGTLRLDFGEFRAEGGLDALGRHAVLGGSDVDLLTPQLVLLARQPSSAN